MQKEITLYCPQPLDDGKTTITYKSVTNFTKNADGTVSFDAVHDGASIHVDTPLVWRLKTIEGTAAPAAGNRGRFRNQ